MTASFKKDFHHFKCETDSKGTITTLSDRGKVIGFRMNLILKIL